MEFIDACLDICLIILMVSIIILVGVEIVLLIIRAIIAYKEDKEKAIEEKKKESYLVHITFKEQVLGGSHTTKLIYVKATSPKEALKRAEEYYMEHCSIPALKSLYEKGEIVIIARCIDDCAIIW